jgi:hypothetical protein
MRFPQICTENMQLQRLIISWISSFFELTSSPVLVNYVTVDAQFDPDTLSTHWFQDIANRACGLPKVSAVLGLKFRMHFCS